MDDRGRHETIEEMLVAWDRGESVWSVEMGGLGPGYVQAIQILAMECLRELSVKGFNWTDDKAKNSESCRAMLDPVVDRVDKWPGCGFSGAQVGAAMSIAARFHRQGPLAALDSAPENRHIQTRKTWPHEPAPPPAASEGE